MKQLKDLLLLGDPALHKVSEPVQPTEISYIQDWIADLHHVMEEIRGAYRFGRGIALPQLGIRKRVIYINIDKPLVIINPEYTLKSDTMFEVWDDCMCFPNLLVRVQRHRVIQIKYLDESWQQKELYAYDDLAELIQHEMDHLDGVLATERAIDNKSFRWRGNY